MVNVLPPVAILAGGLATRLRPVSEKIPKSLIEVAGEPFLAHQLRMLAGRGARRVVLCCGYLGEMIRDFAGDGSRFGLEVEYSFDGPVLAGTATEHNDIQLHLFAEQPESITFRLMDLGIDHEVVERRVRYGSDRVVAYPGVHFEVDDHMVDATVFPIDGIRQAPVSPVDGKPMRRIDAAELEVLLDANAIAQ